MNAKRVAKGVFKMRQHGLDHPRIGRVVGHVVEIDAATIVHHYSILYCGRISYTNLIASAGFRRAALIAGKAETQTINRKRITDGMIKCPITIFG